MSRLSLSSTDKLARDWFVEEMESLNCKVSVDAMGNTFAVRPGRREGPATFAGSHLDTQPTGGRYDGILGVIAGVEAIRAMEKKGVETEYPTGVINWTNEEGARFPISMVSSAVWAGHISLEKGHNLQEVGGGTATMKSELERIGYLGEMPATHEAMPIGAHFELHIEQGPLLEAASQKIGAVQGVQAYRWHTITVHGRDAHTGATDFRNRADSMLTAAKMILHSHNLATKHKCLASTGILTVQPGSTNTVPRTVRFSLDLRTADDGRLMAFEEQLRKDFDKIAAGDEPVEGLSDLGTKGKPCSVEWTLDVASKATIFHKDCIECVEQSAAELFGGVEKGKELTQRMVSGAGHDSVHTSKRCPTSMIFVPCKDGKSHTPSEYCAPEDCGNGADVLLGAVLRYDQLRATRAA
ncbi:MAG: hypothetical protein M4579_005840 [Chaenotheca gracillima]|nr:MAG: hypothetical protein M4579_005840 [Chaenotheca gracillima]